MIEAKNITLVYPNTTRALDNVDLDIQYGDLVYIIGPSGSGKTSLLKLLMGIEYPTEGRLKVLGQSIVKQEAPNIRKLRRNIGPIFQEFRLIEGRTAMENVILGMRFLDIPLKQIKENAHDALVKVGLEKKSLSLVENLSWGERQRVAIARAIARKPKLILADEPSGNLDKDNALNILSLLNSFKDEETTIIITTHATHLVDYGEIDKLIRVDKGKIKLEGLGRA